MGRVEREIQEEGSIFIAFPDKTDRLVGQQVTRVAFLGQQFSIPVPIRLVRASNVGVVARLATHEAVVKIEAAPIMPDDCKGLVWSAELLLKGNCHGIPRRTPSMACLYHS